MSATIPRIDAHQHFWKYSPEEYAWIGDDMPSLRRDFLPGELHQIVTDAGIHQVVSVQARQSLEESHWLLQLAAGHDFIMGVVGWVPLADPHVERHLEELGQSGKLRGIRHFIQDEPDEDFLLREAFNRGVAKLRSFGLAFDLLVTETQLPAVAGFVDRHPHQQFVLDHLGKPKIRDRRLEAWRRHMLDLARRPNVTCKLSGLVTEADPRRWTLEDLRPYVDVAVNAFGPKRLMFGSDWPVCLLAASHEMWRTSLATLLASLSQAEQDWIWGGTALGVYGPRP
jgi:L-fuconolactonase